MPFAGTHAKAGGETIQKLRRQRDLGHQNQRLPPLRHRSRCSLKINLGLARSGDAFKQRAGESVLAHAGGQLVRSRRLIGLEARWRKPQIRRQSHGLGRQRDGLQSALVDQAVDHADGAGGGLGERGF